MVFYENPANTNANKYSFTTRNIFTAIAKQAEIQLFT